MDEQLAGGGGTVNGRPQITHRLSFVSLLYISMTALIDHETVRATMHAASLGPRVVPSDLHSRRGHSDLYVRVSTAIGLCPCMP